MGIDVYMRWKEMTESHQRAQYTWFEVSARAGGHGYLREAYHGTPYATRVLVPEAFDDYDPEGVAIPVETLRQRLPAAIEAAHLPRADRVQGTKRGPSHGGRPRCLR